MGIFSRDPEKKARRKEAREIKRHMRKNGIHGSDGLIYNEESGQVEYDKNQDGRDNGSMPTGTPPYNPNP